MTTEHDITVSIPTPDGGETEHIIRLSVDWGEYQINPCDKEPSRYQGEDDGREIEAVRLIEEHAP
jgi:hypothetical protein